MASAGGVMHLRAWLNRARRWLLRPLLTRMVFGECSAGQWRPHSRIAPSTVIDHEHRLTLADHVFVGPLCFIEASGGVTLGRGTQLTHHVSIVTHSSHRAQRLLGAQYVHWREGGPRPGWVEGPVVLGAHCFIGPHTLLEAGTALGDGCIVRAGSVLRGAFPAHAVIAGNPAQVVGDARQGDAKWLAAHPELQAHYDAWVAARA